MVKDFFLWEVSFECGNKVGGIWTVISSKMAQIKKKFGDNYYAVGFFNPERSEVLEEMPPKWLLHIFRALKKEYGINFRYGKWLEGGNTNIILVDAREFQKNHIDRIKGEMWDEFGIDSLDAGGDFDEPLAWSYAVGLLLERAAKKTVGIDVVQVHEWLSAGALLYLKSKNAPLPLVFTTHATVLGRSMGRSDLPPEANPDEEALKHNVKAKHMMERVTAHEADVFTTVSETTSNEALQMLGKKPDVITQNAMSDSELPSLAELLKDKMQAREKVDDFVKAYFFPYQALDLDDYLIVYTAGRYEFDNKGYDLMIDALGKVNHSLKSQKSKKWLLALIMVPAGTLRIKEEVIQNFIAHSRLKSSLQEEFDELSDTIYEAGNQEDLIRKKMDTILKSSKVFASKFGRFHDKNPPLCAFQLSSDENKDLILNQLKKNGLLNRKEDRVKVVFYPVYITRRDELLRMKFSEVITAASMGVFLSRYEPWGYTPMEAAAYMSVSLTTDHSGFGMAIKNLPEYCNALEKDKNKLCGIHVVSNENQVDEVAKVIETFSKMDKDERINYEVKAFKGIKAHFTWKNAIKAYLRVYDMAVRRMAKRSQAPRRPPS
ncbi:MAG: glycosyltransferase [Candidatus Altiarchaeota archaeon]|nr:glycosyltransferase [Candidatus Altiarchaeota archaeon]